MRKHRLSGVVIAILIGLGTFTHRSDTPHRIPGTRGAGIQLASADLPAGRTVTAAHGPETVRHALFDLVVGQAVADLSSSFRTQAPVWDVRVAQLTQRADVTTYQATLRAEVTAYLAAVTQRQAQTRAYLEAMAARPRPVPAVAAARSAPPAAAARPAAASAPAPAVRPAPTAPAPFAALRQCESGGDYRADTGNGYYGAYQFNLGTWRSLGYGGLPSQAPPAQQDQAAQELQARRGWGQWPSCARRLGLA
ncbi:MAG TPA: transglycosylase family protein [Acidimicrobiales bacterium]|nr:transglycosylase family protein [Acidimicrobiales bacterium]